MKTGVFKISSQEDFDTAWELWNDFVLATINSFVPKVVQLYNCGSRHGLCPTY